MCFDCVSKDQKPLGKMTKIFCVGIFCGNSPFTDAEESIAIWTPYQRRHINWSSVIQSAVAYHIISGLVWPTTAVPQWCNRREISAIIIPACYTVQGWGLLRQFPPFRYFANFSALSKQTLAIEYPVYIWQVSPQLSCGDTCQMWTWFEESNMYFCHIENFAYGEINERSFSNPHPCPAITCSKILTIGTPCRY